jgi:hypothetical protein
MHMDEAVQSVYDWNLRFGHITGDPYNDSWEWKNVRAKRDLALDLIEEEVEELGEACLNNDKVEMLDAVCDILVTVFGLAAKAGINQYIPEAFREVMNSNWSKLDAEGNPVYYESGKIGKSDLYYPPSLADIIEGIDEGVL